MRREERVRHASCGSGQGINYSLDSLCICKINFTRMHYFSRLGGDRKRPLFGLIEVQVEESHRTIDNEISLTRDT